MSDNIYDRMKLISQILLPATGALYFSLSGVWDMPARAEVLGTVLALITFLGIILKLSSSGYRGSDARFSGAIHVGEELGDGMQNFHIELPLDAKDVMNKKELVLKVNNPQR